METWANYSSVNSSVMSNLSSGDLNNLLNLLLATRNSAGTLWILGNGGSASLASHAVADFSKTAQGLGAEPLKTQSLSEMVSLQSAFSNDESFEYGFARTLEMYSSPDDTILVFSVSGRSPNLLRAIEVAISKESKVAAIVGNTGEPLRAKCDAFVAIDSTDYQIVENVQLAIMHWITKNL
jgi:D-sedoheptulose 7-phosphate isomerase